MSDQTSYERLGVTEDSSFEDIQAARDRLIAQHPGDPKQQDAIETAYDAVLMDRLRLRQEGRIKVPDRIRFPEKSAPLPVAPAPPSTLATPRWLQGWIDTPTPQDIWLPGGILTALGTAVLFAPSFNTLQMALVAGVGSSFYFLFRKERKLGRAILLGLGGLVIGFTIGGLLGSLLQVQLLGLGLRPEIFVTVFTFIILWLFSSFLK
jgi:Protein CHAPERONE-LIKE PROTEIN OF POR1-like